MVLNLNAYSDIHRAALQTLMSHGTIEEEQFLRCFKAICDKFHPDREQDEGEEAVRELLNTAVEKINEKIGRFDQKIICHQYGLNQQKYFVFTSTAKTSVAKMQHHFSEHELEYFKQIFTRVIENEDLNITPREALNLQTETPKVTKQRAEKLIEVWIASGYFYRTKNLIFLGPKAILEFAETIQSLQLHHLRKCGLCDEIAAWGVTCNSCKTATFHKSCIQKFLARSEKCPCCNKNWTQAMEE